MIGSALDEVREAERDAERLVEEAKLKALSIVSEARAKASQLLKDREAELSRNGEQLSEKQGERLRALREKILAEGSSELKSLRRAAEKKSDAAVGLVLDAVEKEIVGQ
ncbi:hypothetical protein HYU18_02825 [Candidatus Woesearchaeota archaeon]|nr:hypothetical protein [Candidatus Woesearchaeota archaeon]